MSVAFAFKINLLLNSLLNRRSVLIEDQAQIFNSKHLTSFILVEHIQSHSESIRTQSVFLGIMHREVSLKDFELARQSRIMLGLQSSIWLLKKVIKLDEELSDHLLLKWFLVRLVTLNLVPQLNL